MENAADALKIAFAIFVFVLAITITFSIISQAKSTADVVLYHTDETNFYGYSDSKKKNRVVSVSDVISTLYRYYNESISVTVNLGSDEKTYTFNSNLSKSQLNKLGLDQEPATEEAAKSILADFIENILLKNISDNSVFSEEFVEVPIDGIYETGEDGTQIVKSSGEKKIYITYTLQ